MNTKQPFRRPFMTQTVVVDGNALAFRSLFSHEMLSATIGGKVIYTGMPFGFIRMLLAIKKKFKPQNFVVMWDGGYKKKKEIYPEYKKGRKIKSEGISFEDIITSIKCCMKLIKLLGVPQYRIFGEEGDDLIASFVCQNKEDNHIILTNDHDMFQLLHRKNVRVVRMHQKKAKFWNEKVFMIEHNNLDPFFYPHYLSIVGDKTDNIPGIKGLGDKKVSRILEQLSFPTLDNLFLNLDRITITAKDKEKLIQGKEIVYKFLKIIKLNEKLELLPLYKYRLSKKKLIKYLKKLKFQSILRNEQDMYLLCDLA